MGAANSDNAGSGGSTGTIVREIAAMAGVAFVLVLLASIAAGFIGFIARSLYLIVALVFVYLPYWWLEKKGLSFEEFGLYTDRIWRNIGWGLIFTILTAVPFAGGYYVWETYSVGHSYSFGWSNYLRWSPELKGSPSGWGREPGVWLWTDERDVHVGVKASAKGASVDLEFDKQARPRVVGPARLIPAAESDAGADGNGAKRHKKWRLEIPHGHKRAEVTLRPEGPGTEGYPEGVEVSIERGIPKSQLYVGPGAKRVSGGDYSTERGLRWLILWLLTQVIFIALPEEFFYRGYLQTRIRHAIERMRGSPGEEGESRSWFGVSEENLVASAIFGLAHLFIPVGGRIIATRVSVIFPSVAFGWLRDRTGTITAGVVYHAACNMLVLVAAPHFF